MTGVQTCALPIFVLRVLRSLHGTLDGPDAVADDLAEFTAVHLDGRSKFQTGQFLSFSGGWGS